jgi:hypothetical protein
MPEPDEEKMIRFIIELRKNNIPIKAKELRNSTEQIAFRFNEEDFSIGGQI